MPAAVPFARPNLPVDRVERAETPKLLTHFGRQEAENAPWPRWKTYLRGPTSLPVRLLKGKLHLVPSQVWHPPGDTFLINCCQLHLVYRSGLQQFLHSFA